MFLILSVVGSSRCMQSLLEPKSIYFQALATAGRICTSASTSRAMHSIVPATTLWDTEQDGNICSALSPQQLPRQSPESFGLVRTLGQLESCRASWASNHCTSRSLPRPPESSGGTAAHAKNRGCLSTARWMSSHYGVLCLSSNRLTKGGGSVVSRSVYTALRFAR